VKYFVRRNFCRWFHNVLRELVTANAELLSSRLTVVVRNQGIRMVGRLKAGGLIFVSKTKLTCMNMNQSINQI